MTAWTEKKEGKQLYLKYNLKIFLTDCINSDSRDRIWQCYIKKSGLLHKTSHVGYLPNILSQNYSYYPVQYTCSANLLS